MIFIETNQYVVQYRWLNELLLVTNPWWIPKNFNIKAAVFSSKNWIGNNCLGDLFQSLPEFKLLKFGFRSKTTLPLLAGCQPRWSHICWTGYHRGCKLFDKEFFELVKSGLKDANRSSKVACPDKSLTLCMMKFDLFKNPNFYQFVKAMWWISKNTSFGCKPCVTNYWNVTAANKIAHCIE